MPLLPEHLSILAFLRAKPSATDKELARVIDAASPNTAKARRRELESQYGMVVTVHADAAALGVNCQVLVFVRISDETSEGAGRFEAEVTALPEVVQADRVSGDFAYVIRVAARDALHFENVLREQLIPLGIRDHTELVVLKPLLNVPKPLPLPPNAAPPAAGVRRIRRR